MCYSAEIEQQIREYLKWEVAHLDMEAFEEMFRRRLEDKSIVVAKALEASFNEPRNPVELRIKCYIDQHHKQVAAKWEADLFDQSRRLADAERKLKDKLTKKATEDERIATKKISWLKNKLADLKRTDLKPKDSRIFPFWYAPVVVVEKGRRILRPMRYHCRPNGKPASYDRRFDGLYNARRDSLEKFWKGVFGHHHAFVVAHSFYENVFRHRAEGRELRPGEEPENVVLHFNPRASGPMALACLWDRWQAPGQADLESFAAITDEPPPEVSAAGHDRCIIPLKQTNLDTWLTPEQQDKTALYAILDDRERPYYEHRLAA